MTDQQHESLRMAREIVTRQTGLTECMCDTPASKCGWCQYSRLIPDISAALAAARQVPPGHVRGSDGRLGKITNKHDGGVWVEFP